MFNTPDEALDKRSNLFTYVKKHLGMQLSNCKDKLGLSIYRRVLASNNPQQFMVRTLGC